MILYSLFSGLAMLYMYIIYIYVHLYNTYIITYYHFFRLCLKRRASPNKHIGKNTFSSTHRFLSHWIFINEDFLETWSLTPVCAPGAGQPTWHRIFFIDVLPLGRASHITCISLICLPQNNVRSSREGVSDLCNGNGVKNSRRLLKGGGGEEKREGRGMEEERGGGGPLRVRAKAAARPYGEVGLGEKP